MNKWAYKWAFFFISFVVLVASLWGESLTCQGAALIAFIVASGVLTRSPRRPRVPAHPTKHTQERVGRIQLTSGSLTCGGAPDFRRGPSLELRTSAGEVEVVATVSHRGSLRRVTSVDLIFSASARCDEDPPSVVVEGGVLALAATDRLQPIRSQDYLRALEELDERSWRGADPWLVLGDAARPWCVVLWMEENSIYPLTFRTEGEGTTVTMAEG